MTREIKALPDAPESVKHYVRLDLEQRQVQESLWRAQEQVRKLEARRAHLREALSAAYQNIDFPSTADETIRTYRQAVVVRASELKYTRYELSTPVKAVVQRVTREDRIAPEVRALAEAIMAQTMHKLDTWGMYQGVPCVVVRNDYNTQRPAPLAGYTTLAYGENVQRMLTAAGVPVLRFVQTSHRNLDGLTVFTPEWARAALDKLGNPYSYSLSKEVRLAFRRMNVDVAYRAAITAMINISDASTTFDAIIESLPPPKRVIKKACSGESPCSA
jgi:hypothetical protein